MWIMLYEDLFMNIFYHTHVSCVVWQSLGIDPKHLVACALQGQMSSSEVWEWARKMVLEILRLIYFVISFGF
jgi:hypothetical protein